MSTYSTEEYQRNKAAHAERQRRYKAKHKDKVLEKQGMYRATVPTKVAVYRRKIYDERKALLAAYKAGKQCSRCGFSIPCALDFHHRDPTTKEFSISEAIGKYSWQRMLKEIAKCDIVCRNCHSIIHEELRGQPATVA